MDYGLDVYGEIADGISGYLEMNGFSKVQDIIGLAHGGN
jgi:dihydroorotate dehydrogenase